MSIDLETITGALITTAHNKGAVVLASSCGHSARGVHRYTLSDGTCCYDWTEVTDEMVTALLNEAAVAGDQEMVDICIEALGGDQDALVAAAEAMVEAIAAAE